MNWPRAGFVVSVAAAVVLVLWLLARLLISAISDRPNNLGVANGRLAPCPDYPNCVCSFATDDVHHIEPMSFSGTPVQARDRLVAVLESMPRVSLVVVDKNYVYAEAKTAGFGYVDDIEFLVDEAAGVIHIRSGARLPYYDFHVNLNRVESVRAALTGTADASR